MSPNHKYFTTDRHGDVAVIDLTAGVKDALAQDDLAAELTAFLAGTETNKVVVNFSAVVFCTSGVMGRLIAARRRLKDAGGEMKLCELSEEMREVFRRLRLENNIFEIYETEYEAVGAFDSHLG